MGSYIVHKNGAQLGPFASEGLCQQLTAGHLAAGGMAWDKVRSEWLAGGVSAKTSINKRIVLVAITLGLVLECWSVGWGSRLWLRFATLEWGDQLMNVGRNISAKILILMDLSVIGFRRLIGSTPSQWGIFNQRLRRPLRIWNC